MSTRGQKNWDFNKLCQPAFRPDTIRSREEYLGRRGVGAIGAGVCVLGGGDGVGGDYFGAAEAVAADFGRKKEPP